MILRTHASSLNFLSTEKQVQNTKYESRNTSASAKMKKVFLCDQIENLCGLRDGQNDATHWLQILKWQKETYLCLKSADGRIFTLSSESKTNTWLTSLHFPRTDDANLIRKKRHIGDANFAPILRFEILVPHSTCRITYNDWLRVQKPNAQINKNVNAEEDEFYHVVFSFL